MEALITRKCCKCHETKPIEEFAKSSRKRLGRDYICKPCERAKQVERRLRRGKVNRVNNPAVVRAAALKYQSTHPVRKRAHDAAAKALKSGRIIKGPCERCGSEIAEMHHDDYAKPLEIRWLCSAHHREYHRLHGPGRNG